MLKVRENLPIAYIFKHPQKAWSVVLIIHAESRAAFNAKVILLLAIVITFLLGYRRLKLVKEKKHTQNDHTQVLNTFNDKARDFMFSSAQLSSRLKRRHTFCQKIVNKITDCTLFSTQPPPFLI